MTASIFSGFINFQANFRTNKISEGIRIIIQTKMFGNFQIFVKIGSHFLHIKIHHHFQYL